ncbi:MAG: CBS domain-containing protein [Methylocystis sp.]|uniref:CBS domain-containing protein n=1 Tax=Methylocystis sp. TaxID=1911079 RepID=UPI003D0A0487
MQISNVMSKDVASIVSGETLHHAASEMAKLNIGSLPVIDGGNLAGIVTDRDIVVRGVAQGLSPQTRVGKVMTTELFTCAPTTSVDEAAKLMGEKQIRRLYVVDQGRLVGVVSLGDLSLNAQDDAGEALTEISKE